MKHNNERLAALSRRLDPLWRLVSLILGTRRNDALRGVPRTILLVELHLLGDMVMLVPLLRVIRRCHPQAHVGLMAGPWARDVLADSGLVDEFIPLRAPWVVKRQGSGGIAGCFKAVRGARARPWDWGIDVRGDVRNVLLLALARARRRIAYDFTGGAALLTDVVPDDGVLRHIIDHHAALADYLAMPMTAVERIPSLGAQGGSVHGGGTSTRIGFHFGASMALRTMPLDEACALLLSYEARLGAQLILVDAPDVRRLNSAVLERLPASSAVKIERWQGSLAEFMPFLRTLDQFFAMDSGPAHLAAALGVATTVFFGPHLSMAVRPLGRHVTIVEREDVSCRPCDQHRCTNPTYQKCLTQVVRLLDAQPGASAPAP